MRWIPSVVLCGLVASAGIALAQTTSTDQAQDDFDRMFDEQTREFDRVARAMEQEWQEWARADSLAFEEFRERVVGRWGSYAGTTRKDWVEYAPDLGARSAVDFESGEVTVEVLVPAAADPQERRAALRQAAATLVTDRGRTMDYPVLDQEPEPILDAPVLDGQLAPEGVSPDEFAADLVQTASVEEAAAPQVDGVAYLRLSVTTQLVPNHLRIRAERYLDMVREQADPRGLDARMVLALIQTESYFNPKARSRIPAFGLMQLVPASGGRDAWRAARGEDRMPTPNELYDPDQNIELGCAYLALIRDQYLAGIEDDQSRLYCAISAYNTGAGNVSRAFTGGNRVKPAIAQINSMSSEEVLATLCNRLPYEETRQYIQHVLERARYYEEWKN